MEFKLINRKSCLALGGVVLLMAAIGQEKNPLAASGKNYFNSPQLTYASMDMPYPATNSGFLDNINLSLDPPVKISDSSPHHASLAFQGDLPSESFAQLPARLADTTKSVFAVTNRQLSYKLLGSGDFAFKLNLAPAYPRPEAAMPTGLDPGFGISLKF